MSGNSLRLAVLPVTHLSLPLCRFRRKYKVKLVERRAFREIQ